MEKHVFAVRWCSSRIGNKVTRICWAADSCTYLSQGVAISDKWVRILRQCFLNTLVIPECIATCEVKKIKKRFHSRICPLKTLFYSYSFSFGPAFYSWNTVGTGNISANLECIFWVLQQLWHSVTGQMEI